ncbi:MAG: N-acetylglucosamine-6-phosphate deacetylase [Ilumatobacteraceae bacterium]
MTIRRLGAAAAVVRGTLVAGDVAVDGDVVSAVGVQPAGPAGRIAVPGFVDLQVNGFAGVDFTTAGEDGWADALLALARSGVTAAAPTMPTAPPDRYRDALATAAAVHSRRPVGARMLGVHLEGPFLSPVRHGAHREEWLHAPDPALADSWLDTAPVAIMTLAPELPGALDLIAGLRRRGTVVSLGHTDATADAAHAGFDAGATMVTHLWNAQRQPTSREPAVGGVAMARPDVHVGVICDLVHVAADTVRFTHAATRRRFVAVTDAVSLAGMPDGEYRMYGRRVTKSGSQIRLDDGTLAGSSGRMDETLRNLVGLGVPLVDAVATMTSSPAAVLGRSADLGRLAPGAPADVVVLDDALQVVDVLVAGRSVC